MDTYLTEYQKEIAKRQAAGETEREVGFNMNISVNTVRYHKKKLFSTLNVNCMNEAIYILKSRGEI